MVSANRSPSPELAKLLTGITTWSFSAFELRRLSGGRPLYALVSHLAARHALSDALKCRPSAFDGFLRKCCGNHLENPYHNAMHVSDVVQVSLSLKLIGYRGHVFVRILPTCMFDSLLLPLTNIFER